MMSKGASGRFEGVIKIVRFNVRFYVLSGMGIIGVAVLLASRKLPPWLGVILLCGAAVGAFWTLSSLLVSWYVYDHAGVTRWLWLPERIPAPPKVWANIHAGLDESTAVLRNLFPGTEGLVVDIYDPAEMTEPSIARARELHPATEDFRRGRYDALPLSESSCGAVFVLFAAHEVRAPEHRSRLLRETRRVLGEGGYVVLVEHLRDWKNFIAFGPGFLHFHSRRSWLNGIREAGLTIDHAGPVTPFVECFVLRKGRP
ncbi:MAG TPA: methyltransferase domain-containing protein [Acidobacteriaceae bacterium]|nr:methyltransferase domain-containing protein [Acidobacteriaceae bacterium]